MGAGKSPGRVNYFGGVYVTASVPHQFPVVGTRTVAWRSKHFQTGRTHGPVMVCSPPRLWVTESHNFPGTNRFTRRWGKRASSRPRRYYTARAR